MAQPPMSALPSRALAPPPVAELHITSMVVHALPGRAQALGAAIAALPGAEIHAVSDTGKLVVTLEAHSTGEMLERIAAVQGQDGVLASAMVYQHIDTLDSMNKEIDDVNGS